jgi:NADH:ubiquinone oxidoreductase subunit 6 (subunit J)
VGIESIIGVYAVAIAAFIVSVYSTVSESEWMRTDRRINRIVNLAVRIVAIALIIYLVVILSGIYFFGRPSLDTSYLSPIRNPLNTSETMYANIILRGEVVSAQKYVFAQITLYPDLSWRDENNIGNAFLPFTFLVIFDGANCKNDSKDFAYTTACNIRLTFNNRTNSYTASHPLNYTNGGSYGIFLAEDAANTTKFIQSDERFIQVESFLVTTEKTNVYVASMIGLMSIVAAIILWSRRRL